MIGIGANSALLFFKIYPLRYIYIKWSSKIEGTDNETLALLETSALKMCERGPNLKFHSTFISSIQTTLHLTLTSKWCSKGSQEAFKSSPNLTIKLKENIYDEFPKGTEEWSCLNPLVSSSNWNFVFCEVYYIKWCIILKEAFGLGVGRSQSYEQQKGFYRLCRQRTLGKIGSAFEYII